MSRNTILPFIASAAILGRRFVKHGAADGTAVQAAAATDALVGVSDPMGAPAGGVCDVHIDGEGVVEFGGPVTRGDRLTADAEGRAIKADPAAGASAEVGAFALVSGVLGDFGQVHIGRSTYTRPA